MHPTIYIYLMKVNPNKSQTDRQTDSALTHLTAMTELNLSDNQLTADDGARICGAAAAAGMTRLKTLDLSYNPSHENAFSASSVVGCGAWRQLNLPQPPDEIVSKCALFSGGFLNVSPLVSYLLSEDKVPSHAIRIFVVGESTVTSPPPPLPLFCFTRVPPPPSSLPPPARCVAALFCACAADVRVCLTRDVTWCCRWARRRWFGRSCRPHPNAPP